MDGKCARLARPGRTCWRIVRADSVGIVVDAQDYYRALAQALPQAQRSILMLGWEFDSRTRLIRGEPPPIPGLPSEIGPLLAELARRRPQLGIHVLVWDSTLLYAVNREFAGLVKMDWLSPPGLHFRLDCSHPLGASHHQKVVVIDDQLAFIGGLDVTSQRWDSREHAVDQKLRADPGFPTYPPFHDVMAVVDGKAAAALGDLCRARWRVATGERLAPSSGNPSWPSGIPKLFSAVDVALSRTSPPWDGEPPAREIEALFLKMIAAARRQIFIENQYFACPRIAQALAARLADPCGPEVVIIGPGHPHTLMERSSMGLMRARLAGILAGGAGGERFGLYTPRIGSTDVKVHSKLTIVDDRVLRIGSANLANRSMGLDSECDLSIEALGNAQTTAAIRAVRHDLLAEHLGLPAAAVAEAEAATGSLHATIAALAQGSRRLEPLTGAPPGEVLTLIADSGLPDPDRPMESVVWATPPRLTALTLVPVLLALAAGAGLGAWLGAVVALAAALAVAVVHFRHGRDMGRRRVLRRFGRGLPPLIQHGIAAIILLRLSPAADFGAVNLLAGAMQVRQRDFVIGSALGMVPGLFAMSVLGDRLAVVLGNPSPVNIAVLGMATALVIAAGLGLANRLGRARPTARSPSQET
jgi:phospholipase D1/2